MTLKYDLDVQTPPRFFSNLCNPQAESNTRFACEMSKLQFMESFCLPLLSYGYEVLYISTQQISQRNACWNNAYRKLFKMNQWESIKQLQWFCGRLDFIHILVQRKLIFLKRLLIVKNKILQPCLAHNVQTDDFYRLCFTYSIEIGMCVNSAEHTECAVNDDFIELFLMLHNFVLFSCYSVLSSVRCLLV